MTDRLRTGVYNDRSEFARLMGVSAGCVVFIGLELFHVDSDTTVILSDIVVVCSKVGSSTRFSSLFASYEDMS